MRSLTLVALLMMSALISGCSSDSEKQVEEDAMLITTPMELDPTEQYEISRWWSNGRQLLRLDKTAEYALYESQNRYARPKQHGRWRKQSYAVLWLEPYTELKQEPTRVTVLKVDGKIGLKIGTFEPMRAIASPPAVAEDRLFGLWRGPAGGPELRQNSDMRYTFNMAATGSKTGAALLNHKGTWSLVNGMPLLQPDVQSIQPMALKIGSESNAQTLVLPDGTELQHAP